MKPGSTHAPPPTSAANVHAVVALEHDALRERTALERLTDSVAAVAGSTMFIVVHVIWFTVWMALNTRRSDGFDPYPFNLLTLVVSLEAILLTSFVLMSQDRMTKLADKRAHLDLQVNLLAEQELTAVLKVVCLIADKAGIDVRGADPGLNELLARTDVKALNEELTQEMATEGRPPISSQPAGQ